MIDGLGMTLYLYWVTLNLKRGGGQEENVKPTTDMFSLHKKSNDN
jgi:hypothetical protein